MGIETGSSSQTQSGYRRTLPSERRHLFERFHYADAARKVFASAASTLAHAHARSGDAVAISAYLGRVPDFEPSASVEAASLA